MKCCPFLMHRLPLCRAALIPLRVLELAAGWSVVPELHRLRLVSTSWRQTLLHAANFVRARAFKELEEETNWQYGEEMAAIRVWHGLEPRTAEFCHNQSSWFPDWRIRAHDLGSWASRLDLDSGCGICTGSFKACVALRTERAQPFSAFCFLNGWRLRHPQPPGSGRYTNTEHRIGLLAESRSLRRRVTCPRSGRSAAWSRVRDPLFRNVMFFGGPCRCREC